jgi:hypothetical protein
MSAANNIDSNHREPAALPFFEAAFERTHTPDSELLE